ncbi:MAG: hypothetical protein AAF662_11320 [Pseudomonadota bacterium]
MRQKKPRLVDHQGTPLNSPESRIRRIQQISKKNFLPVATAIVFLGTVLANLERILEWLPVPPPESSVTVSLSIATQSGQQGGIKVATNADGLVSYDETHVADHVQYFAPRLPFATTQDGVTVHDSSRISKFALEHAFPFPALDLKIANNSGKVIVANEVIVDIQDVEPDLRPLLIVSNGIDQLSPMLNFFRQFRNGAVEDPSPVTVPRVALKNIGWGPALLAAARVEVERIDNKIPRDPYSTNVRFPRIESGDFVWLNLVPRPLEGIAAEERAKLAIRGEVEVKGVGEISYDDELGASYQTKMSVLRHYNDAPSCNALLPPNYSVDIHLDVADGARVVKLPISQEIRSGEADRLQVIIQSNASARYTCKLTVMSVDGALAELPFVIDVFRPRLHLNTSN